MVEEEETGVEGFEVVEEETGLEVEEVEATGFEEVVVEEEAGFSIVHILFPFCAGSPT